MLSNPDFCAVFDKEKTALLCIITARKGSCGKVMFLQVSVILSTHRVRGCWGHA